MPGWGNVSSQRGVHEAATGMCGFQTLLELLTSAEIGGTRTRSAVREVEGYRLWF
jgi:hypothetical protein